MCSIGPMWLSKSMALATPQSFWFNSYWGHRKMC